MDLDMDIEARLDELGIELPEPAPALANYVPFVRSGDLVSISGQIPIGPDGPTCLGKVGIDLSLEEGQAAARLCAIGIVAQIKSACEGDWSRFRRVVRLGGFVNCVDGFGQQPEVINAASDLMVEIFGDAGRHSRAAVGCNALPRGVAVEIDALVEIAALEE